MKTSAQLLESFADFSPKEIVALDSVGLVRTDDIFEFLPKRYEDRRQFSAFPSQAGPDATCLRATVIDSSTKGFGKMRFYRAILLDGSGGVFGSGKITARWFNMPFMSRVIATGHEIIAYGKVKEIGGSLIMDHPEVEIVDPDEPSHESIHLGRIVPIYKSVTSIPQRRLREMIHAVLHTSPPPTFPYPVSNTSRRDHLLAAHFPESLETASAARRRLALESFLTLQLNILYQRRLYREKRGRVLAKRTKLLKELNSSLPFPLTAAQKRSIKEIIADMRAPYPMNRLLQGDVGSGKTLVALSAILLAIESGVDAALMAPTQILAEQHFLSFQKFIEPLGIPIALHTAAHRSTAASKNTPVTPTIHIGTHALLYNSAKFRDVGLIVIDEQHKFGVMQRSKLTDKGNFPDLLVMTATPIPRTLTMTAYGDLDVSILDEKPPGRGVIVTALRQRPKQSDITSFVKKQLAEGRQAYLVYPLVEESEKLKVASAIQAFEKWQKRLGVDQVGLLHGKLDAEKKDEVMKDFRQGRTRALVATSIIEVGVDVPNANLLILHDAERFGLAQIHQLRGRIGRSTHKSYCILVTKTKTPEALQKLQTLVDTDDGFLIAEADLALRGPGEVLGTAQSGIGDPRLAAHITDTPLIHRARSIAEKIFSEDPDLIGVHKELALLIDREKSFPLNGA